MFIVYVIVRVEYLPYPTVRKLMKLTRSRRQRDSYRRTIDSGGLTENPCMDSHTRRVQSCVIGRGPRHWNTATFSTINGDYIISIIKTRFINWMVNLLCNICQVLEHVKDEILIKTAKSLQLLPLESYCSQYSSFITSLLSKVLYFNFPIQKQE